MSGETDLTKLLQSMTPKLVDDVFVFLTFVQLSAQQLQALQPKATVQEDEGITAIVSQTLADKFGYSYSGTYKCITLTVHSSLEAVGLTAAFATKLKQHGISANVMAGFYHDHIFVQAAAAQRALAALAEFTPNPADETL